MAALGSTSYAYMPSSLADGGDVWIGPSPLYDNPTLGSGAFFLFDTDDRTLTFDSNGTLAGGTTLIASLASGAVAASALRIVNA